MASDELKQRQSTIWDAAPFEQIADQTGDIHDDLVERLEPLSGTAFLDVACGTGGVAERAASRGADVTGLDFAPGLVETARRRAKERNLEIRFDVGDAEALPYEDDSFDVVASCFGVMFAPDHRAAAEQLKRVCRPGGRLALACWTPDGGIADLFRLMGSFQPPPSPGAPSPLEWGTRAHVRELFADAFELEFVELESPQLGETAEELWQLFSTSFGPLKTLADSLPSERRDELHRSVVEFYEQYRDDGGVRHPRHYLVTVGRRQT
jgi:ubiquinone/menaquinone biosynthesis C-methylase UbiE